MSLAAAALLAGVAGWGAVAPGGPAAPTCASAADEGTAALVLQHGDGRVLRRCVSFAGSSTDGETLLRRSGVQFALVFYPSQGGSAVCQLDGEPPTPAEGWTTDNCLRSPYWVVFHDSGSRWSAASTALGQMAVNDGGAAGFRFSDRPTAPPPWQGVCPPRASAGPGPSTAAPAAHPGAAPTSTAAAPRAASPGTGEATPSPAPEPPSPAATSAPSPTPSSSPGPRAPAIPPPSPPPATGILLSAAAASLLILALGAQLALRRNS